jgi:YidC/Oxa1 family membrane protein insertase
MEDSKRVLLAIVLTIGLLWGYTTFLSPTPQPKQEAAKKETPAATAQAPAPQAAPGTQAAPATQAAQPGAPTADAAKLTPAPPAEGAPKLVKVVTPLFTAWFSERGGTLQKMELKKYFEKPEEQGGHYVLLDLPPTAPYSLGFGLAPGLQTLTQRRFTANQTDMTVTQPGSRQDLVFTTKINGIVVTKTYSFAADSYAFGLKVDIHNTTAQAMDLVPEITLIEDSAKQADNDYAFTGVQLQNTGGLVELTTGDLEDKPVETGKIPWMSMTIPYFMGTVAPLSENGDAKRSVRGSFSGGIMSGTLVEQPMSLASGATKSVEFMVFYGPRDLRILKPLGHGIAAAVDFGWFDIIAKPMHIALNFLYDFFGNYGIAIILITILVKILFWPLAAKSYKSMKKMQKLQPQIMKLREKYKGDKQRMNQEVMQMYKTYKVNPMGGCLPMIVQIPVFIAFYKVLGASIELRHAPFMLWINDLSAPDRLFPDLGIPYVGGIPVMTLLMGASMFLQQKMTPTTGDPTQAKMMMLMPVVFTFIFINFPSGLVLYWLVNNVLSIGQQFYTNKSKKA